MKKKDMTWEWTSKKPTKEGFYYRQSTRERLSPSPQIVFVFLRAGEMMVETQVKLSDKALDYDEWAGPIPWLPERKEARFGK